MTAPAAPPTWTWKRLAATLAIAIVGGALAAWARLPLAWMIGAMVATTIVSLIGMRLALPGPLRNSMVTVLGVLLGSSFSPDLFSRVGQWALSLSVLAVYIFAVTFVLWGLLRRFTGYDTATAYFAAVPGGFNEMLLVGTAMGGDDRILALSHAARSLFVVMAIPFWFQFFEGYRSGGSLTRLDGWDPLDLLILLSCAVIGAPLARRLRLPAGELVGPMILSAVVHLTGLSVSSPPFIVIAAAQVIVGAGVGARFSGMSMRLILEGFVIAFFLTVVMLSMTLAFSLGLHLLTGIPLTVLVLAYAPGGLAEMSLIAIYLGADTAFVATHHIVRIIVITTLAPLPFQLIRRASRGMTKN